MEFFTIAQIQAAKTAELVAFYNANQPAEKQIKKFADRATAEKRCTDLMNILNSKDYNEATGEIAASAQEKLDNGETIKEEVVQPKPANFIANAFNSPPSGSLVSMLSESSQTEKANAAPKAPRVRTSNSAGVAASWADPSVAQARLTRNGVTVEVDGVESAFKSVRDAFREHRLPDSKHIRFRGQLKAAKVATFEHNGKSYNFKIVD